MYPQLALRYPPNNAGNYPKPVPVPMMAQPLRTSNAYVFYPTVRVFNDYQSDNPTSMCYDCGYRTMSDIKKQSGCVVAFWIIILCLIFPMMFWVPFLFKKCKDTVLVCMICDNVKTRIPAKMCGK